MKRSCLTGNTNNEVKYKQEINNDVKYIQETNNDVKYIQETNNDVILTKFMSMRPKCKWMDFKVVVRIITRSFKIFCKENNFKISLVHRTSFTFYTTITAIHTSNNNKAHNHN